ncbi:uncharacterized protein LOC110615831 [Manihot esculenta]|uniref:Uncharacterized protein n=1 Tax=Manihot esculenta TaxID=3983 RepID=A0A2C9VTA1_MANES|nr:uncharacterized protein LOC110615831 [Manihot esculenta]OAY49280.1 hypothetical protein MANES_05G043400v8 [Manihot esculenta]
MGGKGRKRREKNYKAAHGGHTRLPPPPDRSQVDALPSKLRHIMSFTSHLLDGSAKPSKSTEEKTKRGGGDAEKKLPPEDAITSEAIVDEGEDENLLTTQHSDDSDETVRNSNDEKRKKKRKRKRMQVIDLRFDTSMEKTKSSEKRRERKKKYLEAKKKKRQKSKTEEDLDFPGHEQIKFGDVVQAPPKLVAVPKVLKNVPEASRERIRLQAIEEYRKRKGWTSRPGLKLPIVTETHPM